MGMHSRATLGLRVGASLLVLAGGLTLSAAAQAQEAAPASAADTPPAQGAAAAPTDIIVTGSRLATGFTSPTPVAVVGAQRLDQRGISNVADALNEVPAFRASQTPAAGELGPGPNGNYIGGRILDLRGLGAVRTLTLVDGKRFVPQTTQATVDTNMIPSILLERAEVVTGGASAQYGSDAVAGVANLILNHKLNGFRVSAVGSITTYGDNFDPTIGAAWGGKLTDTLHLVIGGEYEKDYGVGDCQARPFCTTDVLNFGRNPGVTNIPANNISAPIRPWTASFNGVTTPPNSAYFGRSLPALRPYEGITFNSDGTPRRFQFGTAANNLYQQGGEGGTENIYFQDLYMISPTERYNATGMLDWQATPDIKASLMVNYGHLRSQYSGPRYRNTAIPISVNNPFIPRSSDPTLDIPTLIANYNAANAGTPGFTPVTSFQLGKGFEELGRVPLITTDNVFRVVASLEGHLNSNWSWDAYYQYGHNSFRNTSSNNTITANMLKALNAVAGPNGPVCAVNADAITTNDDPACVAYNPFGQQASAAAKAYVTGDGFQTNKDTQHVVAANLRGNLFDLPYGPLAVAVGGEYRSDSVTGDADPTSQALAFFTANGSRISGRIQVAEAYAEGELPILSKLSFANELSLNGAIRRTHYKRTSDFFPGSSVNVTTWKFGGVYEPIPAIRFRATKSRDIRAPNVQELFGPTSLSSGIVTDPDPRGSGQTVVAINGGSNPNLKPEKANTFTAGIVLKPQGGVLGRFRMSVDYYDIKIKDAIATLGQQNIATRCYQGDAASCALITRGPSGAITQVVDVFQNVNELITRGVDTEISYHQPMGNLGSADFHVLATYVKDFITVDSVGPTQRAGQTGLRGGTPPGLPDWTVDGMVSWNYQAFTANVHVRYINKGFYNAAFVGAEQDGFDITSTTSSNTNSVPSRTYVDLLAQYRVDISPDRSATFFAGVDNVFNTAPPLNPGSHGTGNNILFNPVGTTFKAGFRLAY